MSFRDVNQESASCVLGCTLLSHIPSAPPGSYSLKKEKEKNHLHPEQGGHPVQDKGLKDCLEPVHTHAVKGLPQMCGWWLA